MIWPLHKITTFSFPPGSNFLHPALSICPTLLKRNKSEDMSLGRKSTVNILTSIQPYFSYYIHKRNSDQIPSKRSVQVQPPSEMPENKNICSYGDECKKLAKTKSYLQKQTSLENVVQQIIDSKYVEANQSSNKSHKSGNKNVVKKCIVEYLKLNNSSVKIPEELGMWRQNMQLIKENTMHDGALAKRVMKEVIRNVSLNAIYWTSKTPILRKVENILQNKEKKIANTTDDNNLNNSCSTTKIQKDVENMYTRIPYFKGDCGNKNNNTRTFNSLANNVTVPCLNPRLSSNFYRSTPYFKGVVYKKAKKHCPIRSLNFQKKNIHKKLNFSSAIKPFKSDLSKLHLQHHKYYCFKGRKLLNKLTSSSIPQDAFRRRQLESRVNGQLQERLRNMRIRCGCKKDPCKKEDPCKKKDPCKKEDPCKKKDPCKKEDPCKKKDPCKKEDPCKKKDPCKKCEQANVIGMEPTCTDIPCAYEENYRNDEQKATV